MPRAAASSTPVENTPTTGVRDVGQRACRCGRSGCPRAPRRRGSGGWRGRARWGGGGTSRPSCGRRRGRPRPGRGGELGAVELAEVRRGARRGRPAAAWPARPACHSSSEPTTWLVTSVRPERQNVASSSLQAHSTAPRRQRRRDRRQGAVLGDHERDAALAAPCRTTPRRARGSGPRTSPRRRRAAAGRPTRRVAGPAAVGQQRPARRRGEHRHLRRVEVRDRAPAARPGCWATCCRSRPARSGRDRRR